MSEQTTTSNSEYVKPCVKCGAQERNAQGNCRPCRLAHSKNWHQDNPEKVAKSIKQRQIKPCGKCGATDRYATGPCRPCQLLRSKSRDKDKQRESDRKYREKNRDVYLEKSRQWRALNPDKVREQRREKEARRRGAVGRLSKGIEQKLFKDQNGLCVCCGQPLGDDYHLDHIMPIALGGTNTDDNVQLLIARCNLRKSAKHPDEWRRILGHESYGG
jgi:hypothetical protein